LSDWVAVRHWPSSVVQLEARLDDRGLSYCNPRFTARRFIRRKRAWAELSYPLLSSYLFLARRSVQDFLSFRAWPGAPRILLQPDGTPASITTDEVVALDALAISQSQPDEPTSHPFQVGDAVAFVDGPFTKMAAVVSRLVGSSLIRVDVCAAWGTVPMTVQSSSLAASAGGAV
jgi:transcription antitermination factor NusG